METRRSYRPPPAATQTAVGIGPVELPAAAVLRKGHARENQDLFAGVDDTTNVTAAVTDEQQQDSNRTGERSENSVLFSASIFKSPTPVPAMRPRGDSSTGEIDLCKLAKANGSSLEYKPLTLSEPPMGAFVHDVPTPGTRAPKHLGLFVGAGAAAALLIGIIGVATFAGGADEPTAPKQAAASQATIVEGAKIVIARDEVPAAVTAPVAHKGGKSPAGMSFASSSRSSSASAPSPVTPKKPVVRSGDPCHCKGVLACVIRCSATGH